MEIKKKITQNIRCAFLALGIAAYLLLSFTIYNNYKIKKNAQINMFIEKEKLSFVEKFRSLDNFYKVLELRIKSLNLSVLEKTSSRNIIELQNIIKQNNLLGKIEGITSTIIDLNRKRVITGEKIIDEPLLPNNLQKKFINGKLEYDKFYSSEKELVIFKESYFSKNYPIMLSIEKKYLVGYSDEMKSYLLEDEVGAKEKASKESKIIDEFIVEGRKIIIVSDRENSDNLPLLLWLILPIFPIGAIFCFMYKIVLKFFYKYLVNLWKKIAGEEIENENATIDNIYETILNRNKFLLKKVKENEKNYSDYILRSHILGINSNRNIEEIFEVESVYCGMTNITWRENSVEDIFYKLNKLMEVLKLLNINAISLSSEKIFLYSEQKINQEILEKKLTDFEIEYEISIFTFLDTDKLNIENLHEGSKKYDKYTEYSEKFQGRAVISNIDLESRKIKYTYFYPLNLEQKIITKINSRSLKCLRKILDELFEENMDNRILNLENKNRFKRVLVNSFERIIMHLGRNEIFDEFKEYFEKKELIEQDEFLKLTYEVCEKMMEYGKINGSREDSIEEKIKRFIEENYHKEVSLIDFSDYMKLTPQYSSTIFKKITGENFNNAINNYRIKKAIEIFKEYQGSIKIKVLGEMVGFNNPITFINNFKKIYGVSPTKYFQILVKEEN